MKISIVIPVLNEEKALPETLRNVAECLTDSNADCEIIVADGGSADGTRAAFDAFGGLPASWVDSPRGRGNQMNAGAAAATGDVLLFLHADTLLPLNAVEMILRALADPRHIGGFFRIRFSPRSPISDVYAFCYNLVSHARFFFGDAALFVRSDAFREMGGYRAALIMEDVELIGRLRRNGRLAYLRACATSSSRRFPNTRQGLRMLFVWSRLLIMMSLGAKQEAMERLYPPVR